MTTHAEAPADAITGPQAPGKPVRPMMSALKLTSLAGDLLAQAHDLPQPALVLVLVPEQRIGFQIDSGLDSYGTLWQWADLFGYTVEISRSTRKGRRLSAVTFTYCGAIVEIYAYI